MLDATTSETSVATSENINENCDEKENQINTQNSLIDIFRIPYYGNRENFNLPAEHALAYAEAINQLKPVSDGWSYFNFDRFYPVLIDISGDGVPLLLLVDKSDEYYGWYIYWNILFGYADGALQRITTYPTGIGIMKTENENLLSLFNFGDFGGSYAFYRVRNGAVEFVSSIDFFTNFWHEEGIYSIDNVEVSEDEYWTALSEIQNQMEHFMETDHPGNLYILPAFMEYLAQPFTREQAAQIFRDYAASFIVR